MKYWIERAALSGMAGVAGVAGVASVERVSREGGVVVVGGVAGVGENPPHYSLVVQSSSSVNPANVTN